MARWCNHCCSERAINISHSECVFVALGIQQAHAPYCYLCPARLYYIFPHYLINGMIFGKKKWLSNMKCVLIFSTSLVWHISHSKKNLARFDQKCILVFILRARYSCYIFRKFEFSRQIFEKYSNVKFQENPSRGSRVVPCGETDGRTNVQGRS